MLIKTLVLRALQQHRKGIIGWTLGIVGLVCIQLGVYPTIRSSATDWSSLVDQFPESFKKALRMMDYASERGYLTTELLSFTLPFIVISLGTAWGSRLVTEEEDLGSADIVLSLPMSRTRYTAARFLAAFLVMIFSITCFFLAVIIGTRMLHLSIPISQYLSASVSLFSIGFFMMTIAAAIGALTGKRTVALGISMSVAITLFVLYSLAPLVKAIDKTTRFNPMQWTIGSQPLLHGTSAGYTTCIVLTCIPFIAATFYLFSRRDVVN